MNLEDLTNKEHDLLQSMPEGGFFEERDAYLKKHGIYQKWRKIFKEYVELASEGNIEAIKRALFFLWYQCSEPNQLSGINHLDEKLVEHILQIVNSLATQNQLDKELIWMLPFYYSVAEWYFERFEGLDAILEASKLNLELWQTEKHKSSFVNRGQLGEYWQGIGV